LSAADRDAMLPGILENEVALRELVSALQATT